MLKKAVTNGKRLVSGYLVAVITLMLIFNNSFALSALAAEKASDSNAQSAASASNASASDAIRNSKVTLKNSPKEDVQLLIFSDNNGYEPGDTVCLELYIKNNTDQPITDGLLKYSKLKGIEEDSAYFEDLNEVYQAKKAEQEAKEEEAKAEQEAEEEEKDEEAETEEAAEGTEESETEAPEEAIAGTDEAETEKETAAPAETEEKKNEKETDEDEAKMEDEESMEDEEDDGRPQRLEDMEILPGKDYYVNFYYTIDPEIETMKDQKVDFSFTWTDDEKAHHKRTAKETFRYAVDALNLLPVTVGGEDGYIETGKDGKMLLEFDLGLMQEALEEADLEEQEKNGSRASTSNLLVGWEAENEGRPLGKKDPAVIKNLKCQVETFGLKLEKFKVVPNEEDSNYGTSVTCGFYVSRKTAPGVYYGKVSASYKIKGKSYHTSQNFTAVVKQETGEIELTGKVGDAEIIMSGPVESFPKADDLSLKVTEVTEEQQEMVEEALQKKAEEDGTEINKYKALDIKLIADGEETEPLGDVQVRFKNVNMDKIGEQKAAEPAEEKSLVKRMLSKVKALFVHDKEEDAAADAEEEKTEKTAEKTEEKEEGTEEDKEESSENIKVLHLDEDEVVANEMTSEVLENGDIVMDTDHFSIYIMVDMGRPGGQIEVTIQHWAGVETIAAMNDEATEYLMNGNDFISVDDATDPLAVVNDGGRIITGKEYDYDFYDTIFHRDKDAEKAGINTRIVPVGEIYSPETIKLPNEFEIDAEELSKILLNSDGTKKAFGDMGYKIEKIMVQNQGETTWSEYTVTYNDAGEASIGNPLTLTKNCTMRFVYAEKEASMVYHNVNFYDHNVSNGDTDIGSDEGINDSRYFINSQNVKVRMEAGQNASGNEGSWSYIKNNCEGKDTQGKEWTSLWNELRLNAGNAFNDSCPLVKIVPGLVEDKLDDNYKLQYDSRIAHPDFFSENQRPDGTYASKLIDNYQLGFIRKGDTYKLYSVIDSDGDVCNEELHKIVYSVYSGGSKSSLFSNEFWPLDYVEHYSGMDKKRDKASDDRKTHNWHFGMRYDFDFTVGDYQGPMNFYFRGDDDFWLFVDKQKVIDLGGIHSAVGKAVDMRAWLESTYGEGSKEMLGTHHITIYFMERGGFGSCCYMQYTLPNCNSVRIPEVPSINLTVKKKWADPNDFLRPDKIEVELLRKVKGVGEFKKIDDEEIKAEKTLGGLGDVWECSWTMLPKVNPKNQAQEYIYKVQEKEVKGYIASYEYTSDGKTVSESDLGDVTGDLTCTITNTLSPKVKVEVVKEWDDENDRDGNRPDEVIMQLQYKKFGEDDEAYVNYPGDNGVLTLNGTEKTPWQGIFENLPYYADEEVIQYRVCEVKKELIEGTTDKYEYTVLDGTEGKNKLPGKYPSGDGVDWNYTVGYQEEGDFPEETSKPNTDLEKDGKVVMKTTVTNTFIPKTVDKYVLKNWEGVPSGVSPEAKIGLFINKGASENKQWELVNDFVKMNGDSIMDAENCITWAKQGEEGASSKKEDFILTLPYIPTPGECKGGWKNLSEYKDGVKIEYGIFEIDPKTDMPVDISEQTGKGTIVINNCKYEVSEGMPGAGNGNGDGTAKTPFIITNKYIPAELIIEKVIVDEKGDIVGKPNNLFNEPINTPYKFMIQLIKGTPDNKDNIYTTVALGHEESSAKVYLTPPEAGEDFWIDEIVPMEYTKQDIEIIKTNSVVGDEKNGINDNSVKVYAGDKVKIVVKNTPNHEDFFHHTASATNKITLGSGSAEFNRKQDADYEEKHGRDSDDGRGLHEQGQSENIVDFSAIVEDKESKWKEREWEEGMAIYG